MRVIAPPQLQAGRPVHDGNSRGARLHRTGGPQRRRRDRRDLPPRKIAVADPHPQSPAALSTDRRTTLTYTNGIVATSGYDAANHVTSVLYTIGQPLRGTLIYTYDAAANRTSVGGSWARTGLPPALASANYDAANRISTWT
jgi:hypothetical protein